jgi:hypothetical protein
MRVLTLLVRHGTAAYEQALDEIEALFARQFPRVDWDLVVVDNTLPEHHRESLGSNRALIGGSNDQWEFSSWVAALGILAGDSLTMIMISCI